MLEEAERRIGHASGLAVPGLLHLHWPEVPHVASQPGHLPHAIEHPPGRPAPLPDEAILGHALRRHAAEKEIRRDRTDEGGAVRDEPEWRGGGAKQA
jgi:hypothetical protein